MSRMRPPTGLQVCPPGGYTLSAAAPSRRLRPLRGHDLLVGHALPAGTPSRRARPPGGHALPAGTPSRRARPPGGRALPAGAPDRVDLGAAFH